MSENAQPSVEWIAERDSGPFRSRSHVINHLDMIFGCGRNYEGEQLSVGSRFAVVRLDGTPQWGMFSGFADADKRKRARDHVLAHAGDPDSWGQIEIAWEVDGRGEPVWDAAVPELTASDASQAFYDAIGIWADMEGEDFDDFMADSACFVLLADWRPAVLNRVKVRSFGPAEAPLKLNDRAAMASKHGDSAAWRAFAIHVCKSDEVKRALRDRQGGVCPVCGYGIDGGIVHHVDYDHECGLAATGGPWTMPGKRVRPDCARCLYSEPELADQCLSRLRLVHSRCNRQVEQY